MIRHRTLETNGIRMHVAEAGDGPLVVLCHGFPESWYSWRHQLRALAEAGYHAVAPDQRGYGQTDRPEAIDQYTLLHLVGDLVGLPAEHLAQDQHRALPRRKVLQRSDEGEADRLPRLRNPGRVSVGHDESVRHGLDPELVGSA